MDLLAAVLFGRPILTLLYSPEYADYQKTFFWLMLAAGFGYLSLVMEYTMTATRYLRVQFVLLVVSVATLTLASAILVPRFGPLGAAWGIAAAALGLLLGSGVVNWRVIQQLR